MTADDSSQPPRPSDASLRFDVAETAAGGSSADAQTCTRCAGAITSSYYEANGLIICPRCRGELDEGGEGSSRARRVLAATGLGLLAAIGGFVVYFAIAKLTGYEFGLVAIAVGYCVGRAVHKGSRGRGGWAYQTLAILLTYFAIVSTYIPLAIQEFRSNPAQLDSLRAAVAQRDSGAVADSVDEMNDDSTTIAAAQREGFTVAQAGTPTKKHAKTESVKAVKLSPGQVVVGILALLALAAILPIVAGFSNIIGLLIIGFAVYQAWVLNKRVVLQITGPYRVGPGEERVPASG